MAKVYDALKRVQEERARTGRPPLAVGGSTTAPLPEPRGLPVWKRWSASWARSSASAGIPRDSRIVERMEHILGRLEFLDHGATAKMSQVEMRLTQAVEARLAALEKEIGSELHAALEGQSRRIGQLNTRLSIALGVALIGCLLLLIHS